jgi:uncharacterized protein YeaO (DUF488 family)
MGVGAELSWMVEVSRVQMARVYDAPQPGEGQRVLADRLWPRGLRRDDPRVGRWHKQVAPSTELRRWYGHEQARFEDFAARYVAELQTPEAAVALEELRRLAAAEPITLVSATKELSGSHLVVLAKLLADG